MKKIRYDGCMHTYRKRPVSLMGTTVALFR